MARNHLCVAPAGESRGGRPTASERDRGMDITETTKWPWHLDNSDVITLDPRTGTTGAWPVVGHPNYINGCTVITCELDDGGERVLVYKPTQRATIRAGRTYTATPLMTAEEREHAIDAMAADSRLDNPHGQLLRFAYLAMTGWPEIFDAIYARVHRYATHEASKETTR